MTIFVDTSAFHAILSETDNAHDVALAWLENASSEADEELVTHSYVVTESIALLHARLGSGAVRAFLEDVLPVCDVRFIEEPLHERAVSAYLAALGRRPSFVDRVSFEMMRGLGIRWAFAFDRDFSREGFETVPAT